MGTQDIILTGVSQLEIWSKAAGALGAGGYLFVDREHMLKVMNGPIGEKKGKDYLIKE